MVRFRPKNRGKGPCVLLFHGMGLGAWFWERDQRILGEAGLESLAVDLPGHGVDAGSPRTLEEVAQGALAVARTLSNPVLVGHSMGGIVAQMIARDCEASSMVLVCSATPAGVKALPPLRSLLSGLGMVPGALGGGTFHVPDDVYRALGFNCVDDAILGDILPRMAPWSAQVTRSLFLRRPRVETPDCPILVTFGAKDALLPPRASRLLGDLHHAVTWRFDDLGHMPPLETRGVRHAEAVARWIGNPTRRRITEIDPMAPEEGVGQEARAARHNPRARRSHSRFRRAVPTKPGRG